MTENSNAVTNTFQIKIGKKTYIITAKPSPNAKRTADDAFEALCKAEIEATTSRAA